MDTDFSGQVLLDRYRVEGLIGEGGMGSVWKGVHMRTGRKVAIKVLAERFLSNPSVVERFGREARTASAIQHPGIVEVLDLDQTAEGVPFLVMELLEGESLGDRIAAKGKLSQVEVMVLMRQLLTALDAAHQIGIVHRDLKPDNVFLVRRGRRETLKILDFGISRLKEDEAVAALTVAGSVLGTPHYMAPEQATGQVDVDTRVDIYAAGVVLYECLVGDVPLDGDNYNALIQAILHDAPARPSARGAQVQPDFERVVLRALSKDRKDRPQTAKALLRELEASLAGATMQVDGEALAALRAQHARATAESPSLPASEASPPPAAGPTDALSPDALAAGKLVIERPSKPRVANLGQTSPGPSLADTALPGLAGDLVIDKPAANKKRADVAPGESGGGQSFDDGFDVGMGGAAGLQIDESAVRSSGPARPPGRSRSQLPATAIIEPRRRGAAQAKPKSRLLAYVLGGLLLFVLAVWGSRMAVKGGAPVAFPGDERIDPQALVRIDVTGLPPRASLLLDGLPAGGLPFRVLRGSEHELEIRAQGYETRLIRFTATSDQAISGALGGAE